MTTTIGTHCLPGGTPWATGQMTVPGLNSNTTIFSDAAGGAGNRRGRVIYFPSTGASASQILSSTGLECPGLVPFTTTMNQDGWQVIAVDEMGIYGSSVVTDVPLDSGHGTRAVVTTQHYIDHILQWAAQKYGGGMPTLIAGFSYGAFVTMIAALYRSSAIIGFIARSGPTQWNAFPTDSGFGYPTFNGANTSGLNFVTNPNIAVTSVSYISPTLTLFGSFTGSGISAGSIVTVQQASGGTWGNVGTPGAGINLSYTVGTASNSQITVPYTPTTAPTGTYTASSAQVSLNSSFNGITVPGIVSFGDTSELIAWQEDDTLVKTAKAAGAPLTNGYMPGEGHQWLNADTALYSATAYDATVNYVVNQLVYSSGYAYIANIASGPGTGAGVQAPSNTTSNTTYWNFVSTKLYSSSTNYVVDQLVYNSGNAYTAITPSGPGTTGGVQPTTNTTYWTLIGTQPTQGWVQTTFPMTAYPKIY
jgi:dienelactone hydrolase